MEPMHRKLEWTERPNFEGWVCSECAWVFNPRGPLVGESFDDMKLHYEQQRGKEFKSHVLCRASANSKEYPIARLLAARPYSG